MPAISEPKPVAFLQLIAIPVVCLIECVVIVFLVFVAAFSPSDIIIKTIAIALVFLGLLMIPFWYRTFFDENFVGLDRPVAVQWSSDTVSFKGSFFLISVPIKNIITFTTMGICWLPKGFMVKVKVRGPTGHVKSLYLSTTMRRKREFISFLERYVDVN